ncbi:hypothetical protein EG028_26955 [Chitinophaga barathri]|uniref:Trimeric autotransporter adhesin YadA-like head domain-containing protein n=2 Tax=Chitinophaga barathri TaxID=1647451 RepID=A0A3N4M563_9BACT|nr:hypothetical protein EG028_26955 [Chitinophaga barathri]
MTGAFAQHVYQIRADSVRIYNVCDTAELIIENRTRGVAGFLYNKGNGRTEFRRLQLETIGNSRLAITGQDTIDISTMAGGIDTVFRSGDSIRYRKLGTEYAINAPLPVYFSIPSEGEYGYYQFPVRHITGFDAYNSPDMPLVSDQALTNPGSESSYYTGHVVSNGSVGYQMAVNWDGELTGPKGVFVRTKDDTKTTWSVWRELLFKDYADNKYQLSGSGGGGQDTVLGNSELKFMVTPSKKSFITGPYDSVAGTGNVGIGYNARTPGFNSVAIGNGASTNVDDGLQQGSIAIGTNARTPMASSIAIGLNTSTTGRASIAIGQGTRTVMGVAIGRGVRDDAEEGVAIGHSISTIGSKNILIGQDYRLEGQYSMLLGSNLGINPDTIRGTAKFFAFFQNGFDFQSDSSFSVSKMIYKNRPERTTYFKAAPTATSIGASNIAQTSRLNVNGSMALPIKKVATPYTLTADDYNVVSTAAGILTLPSAVTAIQRVYVLKNASPGIVTLNTTASQKIKNLDADIAVSISIPTGESRTLQSDGTDWVVKDVPAPPVVTPPAGSTGLLQFNNGGTFGASPSLKWEEGTKTLNLGTSSIFDSCKINIGGSHPSVIAALNSASGNFNITGSKNVTATAGQNMTMNGNHLLTLNTTNSNGTIRLNQNGVERLSVSSLILMKGVQILGTADNRITLSSRGASLSIDSTFSLYDAANNGLYLSLDQGVNLNSNSSMYIAGYTDVTLEGYEKTNISGKKISINSGDYFEERISINETGEVGIGTGTPAYKLDVAGKVASNNSFLLNNVSPLFNSYTPAFEANFKNTGGSPWKINLQPSNFGGTPGAAIYIQEVGGGGNEVKFQFAGNGELVVPGNVAAAGGVFNGNIVAKSVKIDARVISASTSLDLNYSLIEADNSAAITVNLPSAGNSKGVEYTIIKSSNNAHAVTIQAAGSDSINGSAAFTLAAQWKTVTLWSSGGSRWLVKYSN